MDVMEFLPTIGITSPDEIARVLRCFNGDASRPVFDVRELTAREQEQLEELSRRADALWGGEGVSIRIRYRTWTPINRDIIFERID